MSSILICSSFNRSSGTDSQFSLNTNTCAGLGEPGQSFRRVRCVQATLPWTAYNVNATNNTFTFVEQTGAKTCVATVPVGNYNVSDMLPALGTAMTAASAATGNTRTYTATYDRVANKISVETTSAFIVKAPTSRSYALNKILGFSMSSDSAAYANRQTAPRVCNFNGTPYAFVHCSLVASNTSWSGQFAQGDSAPQAGQLTTILAAIPVAGFSYGNIINWVPPTSVWHTMTDSRITTLNISLLDENNVPIELNGTYFSIVLEVQ